MNKIEFLEQLKQLIQDELPLSKVNETIAFYDEYITDKSSMKSENEIIDELGSPRLLAKTLIETYQISSDKLNSRQTYTETVDSDGNDDSWNNAHSMSSNHGKWYSKLVIAAILLGIIFVIIVVGTIATRLFFTFGIPIILGILILKGISSLLKR